MKRERDTASTFHAPDYIVRVAADRTLCIVRSWSAELAWRPADFMILAESCYMQGLNDMADSAIRAGWVPADDKSETTHMGNLP